MSSWSMVPLFRRDWSFFDLQRNMFETWVKEFDDDWKTMDFETSRGKFDQKLDDIKRDLFQLDTDESMLKVDRPFITDQDGNKKLSLRFDCSQFKPEEVSVKTTGNRLCVHAKHTEESTGSKVSREMSREYTLPSNFDTSKLTSTLTADGVLQIEGPAPQGVLDAPKEHLFSIDKC